MELILYYKSWNLGILSSSCKLKGEIERCVNHRIQDGLMKCKSVSGIIYDRKEYLKLVEKFYHTTLQCCMELNVGQ